MPYIIDIIVLITIVLVTIGGVRKGIIKAAAELVGAIVAAVLSSWLGSLIATWVFNTFFKQGFYDRILTVTNGKTGVDAVSNMFDGLPDFIVRLLETSGITRGSVTSGIGAAGSDIAGAITLTLSPVFISIIRIFAVIILFIIFMLIVKGFATVLNGIRHIPVLAQLNGLLGGVFGFFFGLLILWLILALISFLLPVMDLGVRAAIEGALDSSILTRIILSFNPLYWIFS